MHVEVSDNNNLVSSKLISSLTRTVEINEDGDTLFVFLTNGTTSLLLRLNSCQKPEVGAHYTCINGAIRCDPGYIGSKCEKRNYCFGDPCYNGNCTSESDGYMCSCNNNYIGQNCSQYDYCAQNMCVNNGTCRNMPSDFICDCTSGFKGKTCDVIDYCKSGPCQNHGKCLNHPSNYSCQCVSGFTGTECDNIDHCANNPCLNGGSCINKSNGSMCSCTKGYSGSKCAQSVCQSEKCSDHGSCMVVSGNAKCSCNKGYSGSKCEHDVCQSQNCNNHGSCMIVSGEAKCNCSIGYSGSKCESNVCQSEKCGGKGTCTVVSGEAKCRCNNGYSGLKCESNVCQSEKCSEHGSCMVVSGKAKCTCSKGYSGSKCEHDVCQLEKCNNHGTCDIVSGVAKCICYPGFNGTSCEYTNDVVHSSPQMSSTTHEFTENLVTSAKIPMPTTLAAETVAEIKIEFLVSKSSFNITQLQAYLSKLVSQVDAFVSTKLGDQTGKNGEQLTEVIIKVSTNNSGGVTELREKLKKGVPEALPYRVYTGELQTTTAEPWLSSHKTELIVGVAVGVFAVIAVFLFVCKTNKTKSGEQMNFPMDDTTYGNGFHEGNIESRNGDNDGVKMDFDNAAYIDIKM
ncbi:adhesive plaque matrix protein 2 [Patella vulgata]|uniref:adhesive plaque matrix protein 2 n=1 Tax=Patella vulgata TaxID=6465 RepID=UPI0024A969DF|nr:adhesive plaque matrix protein 2 [Patella vulgata]